MDESITNELRDFTFYFPHLRGVADRIEERFTHELQAKQAEIDALKSDNADLQASLDGKIVVNGDTSDGYHTFNELYDHRAKLFSVVVSDHRDRCWKSMHHHDGSMYDGMFIVGIDTPDGQASYHYDVDPYWDMFDCKELDRAPEWDGHTPEQAIDRIAKLASSSSVILLPLDADGVPWTGYDVDKPFSLTDGDKATEGIVREIAYAWPREGWWIVDQYDTHYPADRCRHGTLEPHETIDDIREDAMFNDFSACKGCVANMTRLVNRAYDCGRHDGAGEAR